MLAYCFRKQLLATLCVLFSAGMVRAAGLLCSSVLLNEKTLSSVSETSQLIRELAQLKINSDLLLAKGRILSPAEGVMRSQYTVKLKAIIKQLQGVMSEAELRSLIAKEISEIQKSKKSQEENKPVVKLAPRRQMTKQIPLPYRTVKGLLEYIPETDSVLLKDVDTGALSVFNIESQTSQFIQKDNRVAIPLRDEGVVLAINSEGAFLRYDLKNNKVISESNNNLSEMHSDFALSPSGKKMIIMNDFKQTVFLIDTATGRGEFVKGLNDGPDRSVQSVVFINENEILLSMYHEKGLSRIDLTTGKETNVSSPDIMSLKTSPDHSLLVWSSAESLGIIKMSSLNKISEESILIDHHAMLTKFTDQGDQLFVRFKDQNELGRIYKLNEYITPAFTFLKTDDGQTNASVPSFDSKGGRIFIVTEALGTKNDFLEIWEEK
jgi:hypothetical protein